MIIIRILTPFNDYMDEKLTKNSTIPIKERILYLLQPLSSGDSAI